jgi:uncharacterized protein YecE (DUF72 family)
MPAVAAAPRLCVGTSGWNYPEWRADFYAGVPQRRWLAHCAARFTSMEVNATFYRFLRETAFDRWRTETPEGFPFAVKGHRSVTHFHRLKDPGPAVAAARDGVAGLGDRIAVVLWQLPPGLKADGALLVDFAAALAETWPGVRHAVEFRHRSWFSDATAVLLAGRGLANVLSDSPRWPLWPEVTADLAYVRLHGHEVLYASEYGEEGLRPWARRVRRWRREGREVHVYFDNTADGAAPRDALRFLGMVAGKRRS